MDPELLALLQEKLPDLLNMGQAIVEVCSFLCGCVLSTVIAITWKG